MLPFWQAIEAVTKQADQLSPFIWSEAVEKKEEKKNETGGSVDRTDRAESSIDGTDGAESRVSRTDELGEPDFKTMHQSKQWTSERIRKVMQKQSEKWLGVKLNISAWRHIVIGISRRYLQGKFVVDEAEEEVD